MEKRQRHPALEHLEPMIGDWDLTGSHPMMPGVVIHGRASFEWLDGRHFLIWRGTFHDPNIPNSIAIVGQTGATDAESVATSSTNCTLHYFDSRGVSRIYQVSAERGRWRMWRDDPGFLQRMVFTIDGNAVTAVGEMARDGKPWEPDLQLTLTRR